jgi:methylmalonyl-CoA mutase C-terminal domain/subunit
MPRIVELMKAEGLADVPVLVGGIVPEEDVVPLESVGVDKVFTPGATLDDIVAYIRRRTRSDAAE